MFGHDRMYTCGKRHSFKQSSSTSTSWHSRHNSHSLRSRTRTCFFPYPKIGDDGFCWYIIFHGMMKKNWHWMSWTMSASQLLCKAWKSAKNFIIRRYHSMDKGHYRFWLATFHRTHHTKITRHMHALNVCLIGCVRARKSMRVYKHHFAIQTRKFIDRLPAIKWKWSSNTNKLMVIWVFI